MTFIDFFKQVFGLLGSGGALVIAIVADPEARLKIMLAENNFNLEILKQETL